MLKSEDNVFKDINVEGKKFPKIGEFILLKAPTHNDVEPHYKDEWYRVTNVYHTIYKIELEQSKQYNDLGQSDVFYICVIVSKS